MLRKSFAAILWAVSFFACALPARAATPVAPLALPNLQFGGNTAGVKTIAPLGDGSVLIGGTFTAVNGLPRAGLARILADGSLDRAWDAHLNAFAEVRAIVAIGEEVYIGGSFNSVGGAPRQSLARISAVDASLNAGWSADIGGFVNAMALDAGAIVVAGSFGSVKGAPRTSLARVSRVDGTPDGWTNDATYFGAPANVTVITTSGNALYLTGNLSSIAGVPREQGVYRVSLAASNSLDTTWGAATDEISDIAADATWVYLAGGFNVYGTTGRPRTVRVSAATNAVDPAWTPSTSGLVRRILVDAGGVLLAGEYSSVNDVIRRGLAEVDLSTGAPTAWNPVEGNYTSTAVAVAGGNVYAASGSAGLIRAARASPGTLDASYVAFPGDRNPSIEAIELAADGRTYIGGRFDGVNGYPIRAAARINADGSLDPDWRPNPNVVVYAIALAGSNVILGGVFNSVGGLPRPGLAKVGTGATAVVDPTWNPHVGFAFSLAVDGEYLYAGGQINAGGVAKIPLAGSGTPVASWGAGRSPLDIVDAIALAGDGVVVAGLFSSTDGVKRLIKLSKEDGSRVTTWNPAPNSAVRGLAVAGNQLYATGFFTRIGGVVQPYLARLDADTGAVDESWMPVPADALGIIAVRNGVAYIADLTVNGVSTGGWVTAVSTVTANVDRQWTTPFPPPASFAPRAGQLWAGIADARGVVAYPEPFCAAAASGATCGSGMTCQTSVCSPAMAATTTTITMSPTRARSGDPVTITVAVTSGAGSPEGRVRFFGAQGTEIGSTLLPIQPSVTFNATAALGEVVAIYEGAPAFMPSRSNKVTGSIALASTRHDWNSDNRPDILFRNTATGSTYAWRMNGTTLASDQFITTIDPSWSLVGHGDFNGDGRNDMVWRNDATGTAYVWYMNDGVYQSDAFLFTIDPAWKVEAVADFDRDGKPDFLFRNQSNGVGFIWYFNNTTPVSDQFLFSIDNSWIVENVGDFDNDGYPDFFFRNTSSGAGFVWYWNGTALGASNFLFSIDPAWQVVQIADWNADGKVDLVFRNTSTGLTFVWYTDGTSLQGSDYLFQVDPSWEIVPHH